MIFRIVGLLTLYLYVLLLVMSVPAFRLLATGASHPSIAVMISSALVFPRAIRSLSIARKELDRSNGKERESRARLSSKDEDASSILRKAAKLVVYHKPVGMLSVMSDPWDRCTLADAITQHPTVLKDMHPVGRLDLDTSGLLLFSSDGKLTHRLLDPDSAIPRVYEAIVNGSVNHEELQQHLRYGVTTADGVYTATLLASRVFPETEDIAYLNGLVRDQGLLLKKSLTDDPTYHDSESLSYLRVSVSEGKHRMVRRMLHNAGYSVKLLHRSSYGKFSINAPSVDLNKNGVLSSGSAKSFWPPKSRIAVSAVEKVR